MNSQLNAASVDHLRVSIGNVLTPTATVILTPPSQYRRDSSESGKWIWRFSGGNQLETVSLRVGQHAWQEAFGRLRLPTTPLLLKEETLAPTAHQILYDRLFAALKPIRSSDKGQVVVLSGPQGLGKTYCAQYYFYHQAAKRHQMVAWLSGTSQAAFLQDWEALAHQLRQLQSLPSDCSADAVIQRWCEQELGQWLFIIDEVCVAAPWLAKRLPRRGGHVLITTHLPHYRLDPQQMECVFSPLSSADAKALIQAYLGNYWDPTGHSGEATALDYMVKVLGGFPVALTQMALLVRKKRIAWKRLMNQFQEPTVRPLLLQDTVFDQLKGCTFADSCRKGAAYFLRYLGEQYHSSLNHPNQLTEWVAFLEKQISNQQENTPSYLLSGEQVREYWRGVFTALSAPPLDMATFQTAFAFLPLCYEADQNQWELPLAGLSALKLQTDPKNTKPLREFEMTSTDTLKKQWTQITAGVLERPPLPSGVNISFGLRNATLRHVEIDVLTVGKPSEFKVWQLPVPNDTFIPRLQLTQALVQKLPPKKAGEPSAQLLLTAAVTGMGGIGKTELARHFITNAKWSDHYNRRFWLNAESHSRLREEFQRLATYLGLIDTERYMEDKVLMNRIHKWLSIHPGWLMVLDNADQYNDIAPWVPQEGGAVLVTTRDPHPGNLQDHQMVPVPLLTPEEAVDWLYQLANRERDKASVSEQKAAQVLVENLGYLPLAIAQAAAYLREQSEITIQTYQTQFAALLKDETLIRQQTSKEVEKDANAQSRLVVASTWMLSLQAIKKYNAEHGGIVNLGRLLLDMSAYLAPKDIPVAFLELWLKFTNLCSFPLVSIILDDHIGQLLRYSLVERNYITGGLTVHPLVQEVLRININQDNPDNIYQFAILMKIFETLINESENSKSLASDYLNLEDFLYQRRLITHAEIALIHWEVMPLPHLISTTEKRKTIFVWTYFLGVAFLNKGYSKKAQEVFYKLLRLNKNEILPADYIKFYVISNCLHQLGNVNLNLGNFLKAQYYYQQALSMYERDYEKNYVEIIHSFLGLGNVFQELGQYLEARKYYQTALTHVKKNHDENHLSNAYIFNNLGVIFQRLGQYSMARCDFERALFIYKKYCSQNHLAIAGVYVNLSNAYRALGKYLKSENYGRDALSIYEKYYEKDHPQIMESLTSLGNICQELSLYSKAIKYYHRSLAISIKHYGQTHPKTGVVFTNLSTVCAGLGHYSQAQRYSQSALDIDQNYYGQNHPETAITLIVLGNAYLRLRNYDKAYCYYQQALGINENHYAQDHPKIATALNGLGVVCEALGRHLEANQHCQRALTINEKHYGKIHPKIAITLTTLGEIFYSLEDYSTAEDYYRRTLAILANNESYCDQVHPQKVIALTGLGCIYETLGQYRDAKRYYQLTLDINERHYGQNHLETGVALIKLGSVLERLSDYLEAEQCYKRALIINETLYGEDHLQTGISLIGLGEVQESLSQYLEAQQSYQRALFIYEREKNHSQIATIMNEQIAIIKHNLGRVFVEQKKFYDARRKFDEAITIYSQLNHPNLKLANSCLLTSYMREGNTYLLRDKPDFKQAIVCYLKTGLDLDIKNLDVHQAFARQFYKNNQIEPTIEHYQILIRFDPKNALALHNLACLIHIRAQRTKIRGDQCAYQVALKSAQAYFERSIVLNSNTGVHTEYALFLWKNIKEYSINIVIDELKKAIRLNQPGEEQELMYGAMERINLDVNLQQLLDQEGTITFYAYFLAHYLLIQVYCSTKQLEEAQTQYAIFQTAVNELIENIMKDYDEQSIQSKEFVQISPEAASDISTQLEENKVASEKQIRLVKALLNFSKISIKSLIQLKAFACLFKQKFMYFSFHDLQKTYLVNKQWNKKSSQKMQQLGYKLSKQGDAKIRIFQTSPVKKLSIFSSKDNVTSKLGSSIAFATHQVTDHAAVRAFTHPDYDARLFDTWYSPEIVKYLLHSTPNHSRCFRYVFSDDREDVKAFQLQLGYMITLANKLERPAVFISKEPGNSHHWITGVVCDNHLLIWNPLGRSRHHTFYKALAALQTNREDSKLEHILLCETQLQQDPGGLVSCGPLSVEWTMQLCEQSKVLTTLLTLLKNPKGKIQQYHGLSYYPLTLPEKVWPQFLKPLKVITKMAYQKQLMNIRKTHLEYLKSRALINQGFQTINSEAYWASCLNAPEQRLMHDYAFEKKINLLNIEEHDAYKMLQESLEDYEPGQRNFNFLF